MSCASWENVSGRVNLTIQKQPSEVFFKKGVLKTFAKFAGKQLCQSLYFNKFTGCNFTKKEALTQFFSCEFREIFKNTFFTEHLRTTASDPSPLLLLHSFSKTFPKICFLERRWSPVLWLLRLPKVAFSPKI